MEDNLFNLFKELPKVEEGQRIILGIDGLRRSGKTTFVNKLNQIFQGQRISVCVFHIDDYIVERKRRYNTNYEEWYEYYYLQWDVEWLKENLFNKLKGSNQLKLQIYDSLNDAHSTQEVNIPNTCIIIIEGVFIQRKEWRNFYDYIIYINCPREKRFNRESKVTQNNIEKFRKRYWKAEDYYLQSEVPRKKADLVLQN